jgi:hypothetical protein
MVGNNKHSDYFTHIFKKKADKKENLECLNFVSCSLIWCYSLKKFCQPIFQILPAVKSSSRRKNHATSSLDSAYSS